MNLSASKWSTFCAMNSCCRMKRFNQRIFVLVVNVVYNINHKLKEDQMKPKKKKEKKKALICTKHCWNGQIFKIQFTLTIYFSNLNELTWSHVYTNKYDSHNSHPPFRVFNRLSWHWNLKWTYDNSFNGTYERMILFSAAIAYKQQQTVLK